MHLSKAQFTKRILNAQGMLEKVEENTYYLNEPEKGEKLHRIGYTPKVTKRKHGYWTELEQRDDKGVVRKIMSFARDGSVMVEKIEYDDEGRRIYNKTMTYDWMSEVFTSHVDGINTSHAFKYRSLLFEEEEFEMWIDDGVNYMEAIYSRKTGRLLRITRMLYDEDSVLFLEFGEDGSVLEWSKERFSDDGRP